MDSDESRKRYNLTPLQFGIAGAMTGLITRFMAQPLDVLKIRFQLQATPLNIKENAKYTSVIQAVRIIAKEEGVSGLWKGHIPAQYLSIIYGAVQFSSYEMLTSCLQKYNPHKSAGMDHLINIGTGSASGFLALVVSFPVDVLRTHLVYQTEPKIYKGMIDAMSQIYKKEGFRGFTNGLSAACVQTVPMSGLVFCFHGIFTQLWLFLFHQIDSTRSSNLSTAGSLTAGLLAGLCAKTVVYPFDLVKKRLQVQNVTAMMTYNKHMLKCRGVIQCLTVTVTNEGFFGLFKGFSPSLIKAGATSSIYFTVYDKSCKLLEYIYR